MGCQHENFKSTVDVFRQTEGEGGPVTSYSADITIRCTQCDERFEFIGLPFGSSPTHPTVSIDGLELRVPLRPQGTKIPGGLAEFNIRFTPSDTHVKAGLA